MNVLQKTALVFTIIGAINWGLIGLFNFNLVDSLFGQNSFLFNAHLYRCRNSGTH